MPTRGHTGVWRLSICSVVFLLFFIGAPVTRAASGTVNVFYAGSLVNTNENLIGPAFAAATGATYQGKSAHPGAGRRDSAGAVRERAGGLGREIEPALRVTDALKRTHTRRSVNESDSGFLHREAWYERTAKYGDG